MEGEVVAELAEEGCMFIAAKGGAGGLGNAAFRTATNKTPEVAEVGGEGEMFSYEIGEALRKLCQNPRLFILIVQSYARWPTSASSDSPTRESRHSSGP